MSRFPERSTFDGDWRPKSIDAARKSGYKDISSFLYYRLSWQRLDRGMELEDYSPWKNPEAALIDNFFKLQSEEGGFVDRGRATKKLEELWQLTSQ